MPQIHRRKGVSRRLRRKRGKGSQGGSCRGFVSQRSRRSRSRRKHPFPETAAAR